MASNPYRALLATKELQSPVDGAEPSTRSITIVSGTHTGATFAVRSGELVVIGSDIECDICLSDAGIAARHAVIAMQAEHVSIRALDGPLEIDGKHTARLRQLPADQSTAIVLGEQAVRLELSASPQRRMSAGGNDVASRAANSKQRAIALLCFVVFAAISTALVARKLDASRAPERAKPDVAAKAVMSEAELLEQVRDVFRGQGYDANVKSLGGARVQIDNLDERHERVQHAAEQVRADVPQLAELVFSPPSDDPPPDAPPYDGAAGEHLAARVDGDVAYLVADAGTRYFKGSRLPSGHTIRRITRTAVQLEREGQIAWFRFGA